MQAAYDPHPVTLIVVMSALFATPLYVLATYVFSGASACKGLIIASVFLAWGAVMTWVCTAGLPRSLGIVGDLIVPVAWVTPSLVLVLCRDWFLSEPLSQRWLVGLQLWRAIGGVFLIEMTRRHVPAVFAHPAGWGDIAVALLALGVLLTHRRSPAIPAWAVVAVIVAGLADFGSAFFFGFTSSPGPTQLFFPERPSRLIDFPTGMIPLFLVPYAIFFHTLSWLTLRRSTTETAGA